MTGARSTGTELLTSPTRRQSAWVCCQRNGPGRSGADHDGEIAAGTWNRTDIASSMLIDAETAAGTERDRGSPATARACSGHGAGRAFSVTIPAPGPPIPKRCCPPQAADGLPLPASFGAQSSDSLYRVLVGANLTHERATAEAHRIAGIIGGPAFATQR